MTRALASFSIVADSELTVLVVPPDALDDLLRANPNLAREIGQRTDRWNRQAVQAATTWRGPV